MDSEEAVKPNITNLRSITVRTRSLDDLRGFYEALGVEVVARDGVLDDDYVEMDLGGVTMIVRPESPFQPAHAGVDLVIAVDDPQKRLMDALSLLAPHERTRGLTAENVVLTDPDGRYVRISSNRNAGTTPDP